MEEVVQEVEDGVVALPVLVMALDVRNLMNAGPMVVIDVEVVDPKVIKVVEEEIIMQVIGKTVYTTLDLVILILKKNYLVLLKIKKLLTLVSILTSTKIFLLKLLVEMCPHQSMR